jgi:hypothetical protein
MLSQQQHQQQQQQQQQPTGNVTPVQLGLELLDQLLIVTAAGLMHSAHRSAKQLVCWYSRASACCREVKCACCIATECTAAAGDVMW